MRSPPPAPNAVMSPTRRQIMALRFMKASRVAWRLASSLISSGF